MSARKKLWSYVAGKRATTTEPSSRVRVYERGDLPGLFMTCAWDQTASGRPQEMKLPDGIDRDAAEALADVTAAKRRERVLAGRGPLGRPKAVTLKELVRKYHDSSAAERWSEKYRADCERSRDFWLAAIDPETDVETLTSSQVEKLARDAQKAASWGPRKERKLLAYLRAATRWGCDKARLYDSYPLRGLELPAYEPETDELIYSTTEASKLCKGHTGADWRDVLAVNIVCDTGRRISSVLALRTEDILTDGATVILRFRKEFDKMGRGGLVPISRQTAELLSAALENDIVSEFGWIFPEKRLDHDDPRDKPRTKGWAIRGLHRLEKLVGVDRVQGRGFHGLKRTHVTASMEVAHGDTALVGDLTGNVSAELLRNVYRKSNQERSRRQVEAIRKAIQGPENAREGTRETTGESDDAE